MIQTDLLDGRLQIEFYDLSMTYVFDTLTFFFCNQIDKSLKSSFCLLAPA